MLRLGPGLFVALLTLVAPSLSAQGTTPPSAWRYFGGNKAFTRYAPLDQIDRDNVDKFQAELKQRLGK